MSRRQSLKTSTSESPLKASRDDDVGSAQSKNSSSITLPVDPSNDPITVADNKNSKLKNLSIEELRKEISKISTSRKIDKSTNSLKNSSSTNQPVRKNHQLQRNPSVKLSKNTSARLVISRMDSKNNLTPIRISTATAKNNKTNSSEHKIDAEEQQIFTKWLDNRNFLLENPFSLEGFQLDSTSAQNSGQCCCCRKNCASRSVNKAFIGKPAPAFQAIAVVDGGEFKTIKLADFRGKFVVLFFYPRDFSFVCPTEICTFNDRSDEFLALNTQLLACSTDSQFSHLAWINQPRKEGGLGPMKIPLLSDDTHQIAKDYGVYKDDEGLALRGLFIIDKTGILRQITINDLPVCRSVDETKRLLQAIQHADQFGEVYPVGWHPGKRNYS